MGIKKQSMSRKGDCWDNAISENYFKIYKSELVDHREYKSFEEVQKEAFEFIEIWYNRKRIHSYLGYKTPIQFLNYFLHVS